MRKSLIARNGASQVISMTREAHKSVSKTMWKSENFCSAVARVSIENCTMLALNSISSILVT